MKDHLAQIVIGVAIAAVIGLGGLAKFTADAWADEKLELYLTIAAWQADKADIVKFLKSQERRGIVMEIVALENISKERPLSNNEQTRLRLLRLNLEELSNGE